MADKVMGKDGTILSGFEIFVGGKNTKGKTGDGTKISDIEFETVNGISTGIIKQMTAEIEVEDLDISYITHMAGGLPFVLKGNIRVEGENQKVVESMQGTLVKMGKDYKEGDMTKRKFTINLNMYMETVNKISTVSFTKDPYTIFLGGIDMNPDFE